VYSGNNVEFLYEYRTGIFDYFHLTNAMLYEKWRKIYEVQILKPRNEHGALFQMD
jgi:hypothetical protein